MHAITVALVLSCLMDSPTERLSQVESYLDFVETFSTCTAAEIKEVKHKNWTNKLSKTLKMY